MHAATKQKLQLYLESGGVPNLLFHGSFGSGKRTLVSWFVDLIYNSNKEHKASYVMWVNCAQNKGIKFIRDSIKYFAKTNINLPNLFKIVVLTNADKLSVEAQSALRRCIEQFSGSTRFFIIATERHKLLKPIISRFCDIYVHTPIPRPDMSRAAEFQKLMAKAHTDPIGSAEHMYLTAFSSVDLAEFVLDADIDSVHKYKWLMYYEKIRPCFRNETMLLTVLLHAYIFRTDPLFKVFL